MKEKRIWILGGGGAGKTTFAKRLSEKTGIPFYTTDHFKYSKNFGKKYVKKTAKKKLNDIIRKRKWIIEGVHKSEWVLPGLEKAELIIFLDVGTVKRTFRSFFRERKEKRKGKKSKIGRLIFLSLIYPFDSRKHHRRFIRETDKKAIVLKNNKQINEFLEKI